MYATLRNNQLITQGHDGAQFTLDVDGPGVYEVRTCRERAGVVEFGSGLVEVNHLHFLENPPRFLPITDHKVEILCPANPADYAQE